MKTKQVKSRNRVVKPPHPNLVAIRKVKADLATVLVIDVASKMGCSRQNINKHLKEDDYMTANLECIARIAQAIALVKIDNAAKAKNQLQVIIKS